MAKADALVVVLRCTHLSSFSRVRSWLAAMTDTMRSVNSTAATVFVLTGEHEDGALDARSVLDMVRVPPGSRVLAILPSSTLTGPHYARLRRAAQRAKPWLLASD